MQITRHAREGSLEFQVAGRLDADWADHLKENVLSAVRDGYRRIELNLAGVTFLSSAGMGVLVTCKRELKAIDGSLSIVSPSEAVVKVLRLTRLDGLLGLAQGAASDSTAGLQGPAQLELPGGTLRIHEVARGATAACRLTGNPESLSRPCSVQKDCRKLAFPAGSFGIGVGALGCDFSDCRSRFGEFIAAGGAVTYLPTDRANVPDYLVSAESLVAEIQVLHGLSCEGRFSHLLSFEAALGKTISLELLAAQSLSAVGAATAGVVIVAEVEGLVGAALKRSLALLEPGVEPLGHPQVCDWMTFTSEKSYSRSLAMVAGVVCGQPDLALQSWVRPLGTPTWPQGHFHAAVFGYRPMRMGRIDLDDTVRGLFESPGPRAVLHLLNDNRPVVGSGQSEFLRGACWAVPVVSVAAEDR